MRTSNSTILTVSLTVIIGLAAGSVSAAVITWDSTAYNITGDSDVVTTGTFHKAESIGTLPNGGNAGATTVNGVTFPAAGATAYTGFDVIATATQTEQETAPFANLSTDYKKILQSVLYVSGDQGITTQVNLNFLTPGHNYLVQVWGSWAGVAPSTRTETISGSPSVHMNQQGAAGGLGNYVIGRFTADSTDQWLSIVPGGSYSTMLTAYQVRDITAGDEPGDYDSDGDVDVDDYNKWSGTFGSTTDLDADGNGNDVIDAADYVVWRKHFAGGAGANTSMAGGAVPEPPTWLLCGGIVLAIGAIRHRRLQNAEHGSSHEMLGRG